MFKKLCLLVSLIVIGGHIAFAGTVSFDQLATSSDLTVAKYNADMNTIFQDHNTNIQSSNILNDTVAEVDMADDANPRFRTYENASCEKVYTGLLTTTTSGTLTGSVPSGTAYPLGYRVVKSSSTPKTFTASRWTFVDIDISGNLTYSEASIGGAAPSVAPNSIRLSRVSTDGTQIAAVQDLRTTSCSTGTFAGTASATSSTVSLDDIFKNGQKTRRFSPAGRTPQGWAQGLFVSYDTATTFKVTQGSAYINGIYRYVSADTTVTTGADTPSSGISGLDTGTVTGGPLRYYVYAVADQDSVAGYSVTYSTSGTAPSGLTNYRLIGSINTDATNLFTSRDVVTAHATAEKELSTGWIVFDGTGTVAIKDAFNLSSLTDNGTGDYTFTFSTNFITVNYGIYGSARNQGGAGSQPLIITPYDGGTALAVGSARFKVILMDSDVAFDSSYVFAGTNGDLSK